MNTDNYYPFLDLSTSFLKNIDDRKAQDDNEAYLNNYKNSHIVPAFRYYKDDRELNYTPQYYPSYIYKNKSLFGREKPSQTEHDEIGINDAFLSKYFGYTDYGNFNVANQSLPEKNKHKKTPKDKIYQLY
jgi:hypothetical protein